MHRRYVPDRHRHPAPPPSTSTQHQHPAPPPSRRHPLRLLAHCSHPAAQVCFCAIQQCTELPVCGHRFCFGCTRPMLKTEHSCIPVPTEPPGAQGKAAVRPQGAAEVAAKG